MVRITAPGPQTTVPSPAADEATSATPTAETKATEAADRVQSDALHHQDRAVASALPGREPSGGGGLEQIAALANHALFGHPNVRPSTTPDLEIVDPDPAQLAVDVPALLKSEYASLDPQSAQAQAIRDLDTALGGLDTLAPQNYVKA